MTSAETGHLFRRGLPHRAIPRRDQLSGYSATLTSDCSPPRRRIVSVTSPF